MAILGACRESDNAVNAERCTFPLLTMQRGESIAEPYALHVGMGWNGAVKCAKVIACGESAPNRVVHEWSHVTCKRCLGVKSGAHVRKKKAARVAAKKRTPKEPQTEMFEKEKA